jgi:hypothetical protein
VSAQSTEQSDETAEAWQTPESPQHHITSKITPVRYLAGAIVSLMRIIFIRRVLLTACFLSTFPHLGSAQSTREMHAWIEQRGSVPPVPQWFSCFRELKEKPYDKARSQTCLDSIRSHPEIESGKITFERHGNEDLLTFHAQSPSLHVSDIDIGVSPEELPLVQRLLSRNANALRTGETYEPYREGSTWNVLDMFLRSQGRRAGISRTVHLDYTQKTAQVAMRIWDGPPGEPEPLVPPYVEPCQIMNANFNWIDTDDLTPVEFVKRQMKTKWLGCFYETDLQDDLATLKKMRFLKDSKITVTGSGEARNVSLYFRSRPIPIAKATINGYGQLAGLSFHDIPALTIHEGDIYSQSRANNVRESLEKWFAKEGRQVKVFADIQMTPRGETTFEFSVLAYPDDVVYVNSNLFDVSLHDNH